MLVSLASHCVQITRTRGGSDRPPKTAPTKFCGGVFGWTVCHLGCHTLTLRSIGLHLKSPAP